MSKIVLKRPLNKYNFESSNDLLNAAKIYIEELCVNEAGEKLISTRRKTGFI